MTETPVVAPVRRSEQRAVLTNPDSSLVSLGALRTVVLCTLADAFALVPEEILYTGRHLDEVLAPLITRAPSSVPLSVRHEMFEGNFAAALERLETSDRSTATAVDNPEAHRARAEDWAAVTVQMVGECYDLSPMEESTMHGRIVGLLRDLGVDHPTNPRAARYLPNNVRYRLNHH